MAPMTKMLSVAAAVVVAVAVVVATLLIQRNQVNYHNIHGDKQASRNATTDKIQALGRPFVLGMLYDMRKDELIPGMTLWNRTTIEEAKRELKSYNSVSSEVIYENNIDSKMRALNIKGGLQLSILAGLVDVQGSASYLTDTKSSNKKARLALKYRKSTHVEQLSMDLLANIQYEKFLDHHMATHVVTAIVYGGAAFFVFDNKISASENINDIQEEMEAKLQQIPHIAKGAKADLDVDIKDKQKLESFSCKFFGDFSLGINPTTYEEAIRIYRDISTSTDEKAMEVWLYPLSYLQDFSMTHYREISYSLLYRLTSMFEDFNEQKTSSSDLINERVCKLFPRIKHQLIFFQNLVSQYRDSIQHKLFSMLPNIRDGSMDEKELADIVINHEKGPFSHSKLKTWLAQKEREIKMLKPYVDILKDIEFTQKPGDIDIVIANPKYHTVVCFTFKLDGEFDDTLSKLAEHFGISYHGDHHYRSDIPWYENKLAIQMLKRKAQLFQKFAIVNQASNITKLIITDEILREIYPKEIGAAIMLYKDGKVVNDDFEPPSAPEEPSIYEIKHNSISFRWTSPVLANTNIAKYEYICQPVGSGELDWRQVPVTQKSVQISGLKMATTYQIQVRACSIEGCSEALEFKLNNDNVMTLPSSPPFRPSVQRVEATGIYLTWHQPEEKATTVDHYIVLCKPVNKVSAENWMRHNTQDDTEMAYIKVLMPDMKYKFSVIAVCTSGATSDPSEDTAEVTTAQLLGKDPAFKFQILQPIQDCVDSTYSVQSYPGVSRLVTLSDVQEIVYYVNQLILQGPQSASQLRFVVGLCSIVRPTDLPAIFEGVGRLCLGNKYPSEPDILINKLVIKGPGYFLNHALSNKAAFLLYTLVADINTDALSEGILRRLVSAWTRMIEVNISVEELEVTMKHPPTDWKFKRMGFDIHVLSVLRVASLNTLSLMCVGSVPATTTDAILDSLPEMSLLTILGLAVHTQAQVQRVATILSTSYLPVLNQLFLFGEGDLPTAPLCELTQLMEVVIKLSELTVIALFDLPICTSEAIEPICDMLKHINRVTTLAIGRCRCPPNVLQSALIPALRARTSPMQQMWIDWQAGDGTEEDFAQLAAELRPLVTGDLGVQRVL